MTQEKPLVCVVVAVYNQERFIGRCLRSLLHQTFSHDKYEIIVVDDGSTDKTPYALKLFCDPKNSVVRIITNKSNLGLPASLNLAINASKSEYLVRVDSNKLKELVFMMRISDYTKKKNFVSDLKKNIK